MKFSVKDLLAIVAVFAIVFGCAAFVGFDNPLYWITLAGSGLMSALFLSAIRQNPLRAPKSPILFIGINFLLLGSLTLLANALILFVAGVKLARDKTSTLREALAVIAVGLVVSLLIGVAPGVGESRRLAELKQKYPLISLDDRLKYEKQHPPMYRLVASVESPSVSRRLVEDEEQIDRARFGNAYSFKQIHRERQEEFVRAIGFGVGRMSFGMRAPSIEDRPPLRDIPFDEVRAQEPKATAPSKPSLDELHVDRRNDFLDPAWLGAIVNPNKNSVGFVPHAIHEAAPATPSFVLERLDLVSLLKFDEPRVYVLDHLPRMDQLSSANAPTRALDEFETGALVKLWGDEDVVIAQESDQTRMLGSLRAVKQCRECHSVDRGELLGAFSYVFRDNSAREVP